MTDIPKHYMLFYHNLSTKTPNSYLLLNFILKYKSYEITKKSRTKHLLHIHKIIRQYSTRIEKSALLILCEVKNAFFRKYL